MLFRFNWGFVRLDSCELSYVMYGSRSGYRLYISLHRYIDIYIIMMYLNWSPTTHNWQSSHWIRCIHWMSLRFAISFECLSAQHHNARLTLENNRNSYKLKLKQNRIQKQQPTRTHKIVNWIDYKHQCKMNEEWSIAFNVHRCTRPPFQNCTLKDHRNASQNSNNNNNNKIPGNEHT